MKVSAILKGLIDANGHQPIQIRIYHDGKRTFHPTHIKIDPDLFKDGRVDNKHPKAKEYNKTIDTLIIQYQAKAIEGFKKKSPKIDFYTYADSLIPTLTREPGTLRQYNSQINKLKEFKASFYLTDVTAEWLDQYKLFLKKRDNMASTVWSSFKFLRFFIRKAIKQRFISSNPFEDYEFPKYKARDKIYLTEEEIKLIDKFTRIKGLSDNLRQAGNWFLIACDTGMRIGDLIKFDKKKNIIGERLVFNTEKTNEVVGLPIDKHLKALFERVEYKRLSMHQNTYNKLIKVVAAGAGVEKHITTHTARHTAAMSLANKGISQEVTAKILGHRDLRSTRVYYRITNKRVDLDYKKRRK